MPENNSESKKTDYPEYHYIGKRRKIADDYSSIGKRVLVRFIKLLDVLAVSVPFIVAWTLEYAPHMHVPYYRMGNYLVIALYFILYYLITHLYGGFAIHINSISDVIYDQVLAAVITNFLMYIVMWLLIYHLPNVPYLLLVLGVQILIIIFWSYLSHKWYFHHYKPLPTVIIYDERKGMEKLLENSDLKAHFAVIRTLDIHKLLELNNGSSGNKNRNPFSDSRIEKALEGTEAVFLAGLHSHERNQIIKYCAANDIVTYTIPRVGDALMSGAARVHLFHLPMLELTQYHPTPEYIFFKRLFDILLSAIALVILSPLMIVLAIIIRSDGGTAFYRQKRLTKDGRVFEVLKFRSMRMDAEKDGVARLSTGEKDPRITKVGHFIRACRMDELPQLINILKGDMSIVGPRPERPEIAEQYKQELPEFDLRLQCKCGLTGYAQVYGKYNTTPYDKLLMDLMYISHPSLAEDFKICLATVKILFMKESTEGVAEGQTTASAENH